MNIDNILKEIFGFRFSERRNNIDDLKLVYNLLGNPCENSKIIHIAGTNGKGSTATFIESILLEADFNVCKFTSPHILKYNERIVSNKMMISDDKIIYFYNVLSNTVKNFNKNNDITIRLNFFEITTFIALLFFELQNPDFVILEAGLGGRLDATNIVNSDIAVITNITFDHVDILGKTLKQIAYEKTGIIKNGELCIFSHDLPELKEEVDKKTKNSINIIDKYKDLNINLDKKNYKTVTEFENKKFILPLFGKFQAYNFLLAYEIAKIYNISDEVIQKGLDCVHWSGRFELFSLNPVIILDVAHNDDSIKKLLENIKELYGKNEVIIITSLLQTKDFISIFSQLESVTDKIFITSLKDAVYGLTSLEIRKKMEILNIPTDNIIFEDSISIAYNEALKLLNDKNTNYKAIIVCGSFYEIFKFKNLIHKKEK
ncbi:bifunctional folylpolyglutamate synthase/dihydrofolate synthase [Leptotrichia sp. OH3620_COT-345]|uniref:bifunctional folylpolyglutamate synthase/dihydrofolate synthase n=1 Tax=Leptotrichia sp. OH3620_COT-345 TaxID=2491048 RepID=UPI000F649A8B|nr:Mur ligase family protein [Leptotrichia sp. OH3620_COT-345]RRD40403.1 bifunctional folylpolyglutamate synthase/dihydrofolate synthase [Leptotrichia sp. OH3620_COT-345]